VIHTLRTRPQRPPADVIEMLFACHDRIRRLCSLAERLSLSVGAPAAEVSDAARSLIAYFTKALPKHVADEDFTIAPRLHEAAVTQVVRDALSSMSEQHEQIDALLDSLLPRWRQLADHGALLALMPPEFARASEALRKKMEAHLSLEEETIFPAMRRYLSPDSEGAILREMRERRPGGN
jgi:iron-sulfur cluster repair protein YtfE (RIC family)